MQSKHAVLLLILLSALSIGYTTIARLLLPSSTYIGYLLGGVFLLAAMMVGNRKQ